MTSYRDSRAFGIDDICRLLVLVERYRTEMKHAVGDQQKIRANFLEMIQRLFGEMKRIKADQATR